MFALGRVAASVFAGWEIVASVTGVLLLQFEDSVLVQFDTRCRRITQWPVQALVNSSLTCVVLINVFG